MAKSKTIQIEPKTTNPVINLALDTIKINKQALIFVNSKPSAEKQAEEISLKIKETRPECEKLAEQILKVLSRPTKQCRRLALCIKKGIAFHHAGLASKQKEIIEDSFREGKIKIIASTPTLAAGLDLPAFRTIIRDLKRYGPRGMQFIPVLEYHQMAGRAGRPGKEDYGEAITLAKTTADKENITEKFIFGEPEQIFSKLAVEPVLRTYLLSLIATKFVSTRQEILEFFEKTFWAHQFRDMARLESIIDKMLLLLEEFEFIRSSVSGDFVSGNDLEKGKIKATLLGKRVAELYVDPLTAYELIQSLRFATSNSSKLIPFSFLHMTCNRLEMRPLLRVKTAEYEKIEELWAKYEDNLLEEEPNMFEEEYGDFTNSIKTALFMQDWIDESDEETLLGKYDVRPGEIRVKLQKTDWLLYCAEELARIMELKPMLKELARVRFRIKYGVKEELIPLLKLEGVGRVRARKLFNNGYKDVGAVKSANVVTLGQLLGPGVAKKIKVQLDQGVSVVKKGTRKGQTSLEKY
ncbi:helicase-related protein [Nanoarchaeota archaeon]